MVSCDKKPGRRLSPGATGFTLIELLVVMAIVALLLTIAAPRYFVHIEKAREATLKQNLFVMRDAIDKFHADKGRYPAALDELVSERYIRTIPVDPVTGDNTSWSVQTPPLDSGDDGSVFDVRSGATGVGRDGTPYAQW